MTTTWSCLSGCRLVSERCLYSVDKNPVAVEMARLSLWLITLNKNRPFTFLDLGHGFHETKQGVRYTISNEAQREVLGRLLKLNHERYAEEVALGLHEKGAKKGKGAKGKRGRQDKGRAVGQGELVFE